MLISIIIPVYNVQYYLKKCLNSVTSQSYTNLEIILIDDGSTDNSGSICDEYASIDSRVKVIHKKNGGLMSAWMNGLNCSKGEYCIFIDSDDWINKDMILIFMESLKKQKSDLIIANHIQEFSTHTKKITEKIKSGYYKNDEIINSIYPILLNDDNYFGRYINFCRWGKLIKTDLLKENIKYCDTNISYGEDVNIMFPVFLDARSITILDDFLYHYRQDKNSIMNIYKRNMDVQILKLNKQLLLSNEEKNNFDFTNQIINNTMSMTLAYIRNELDTTKYDKENIKNIIAFIDKEEIKVSLKNNTLIKLNSMNRFILFSVKSNKFLFYNVIYFMFKIRNKVKQSKV